MSDVVTLFQEFKSELEKREFVAAQHKTIVTLLQQKNQLQEEVEHLKKMLIDSAPTMGDSHVERIIITPEQALIENQIDFLQKKGIVDELDLEDIKKLDLLLKNKQLIKKEHETIRGESKKVNLSNIDLLNIVKQLPDGTKR